MPRNSKRSGLTKTTNATGSTAPAKSTSAATGKVAKRDPVGGAASQEEPIAVDDAAPVEDAALGKPSENKTQKSVGLPEHHKKWEEYMSLEDHRSYSLTNIGPKSASDATLEQFYTLKVLWKAANSRTQLGRDLRIDEGSLQKASAFLEESPTWQDYKKTFHNPLTTESLFGLVQLYHRRCADGLDDIPSAGHLRFTPERPPPTDEEGAGRLPSLPTESSSISSLSEVTVDAIAARRQVEDEEIVNVAFVLFLNALVRATPKEDVKGDWWPCRSSFCIPNMKHKVYLALVDGMFRVDGSSTEQIMEQERFRDEYQRLRARAGLPAEAMADDGVPEGGETGITLPIRPPAKAAKPTADGEGDSEPPEPPRQPYEHFKNMPITRNITAIIEVKPMARVHSRRELREQILIQEAAQMAAWIAVVPSLLGQKPDKCGKFHRLLFSQDQREVFVTIATYTKEYIHYIMNSIDKPAYHKDLVSPDCFLHMQPYGPFRVDNLQHMEQLAPLLVALSYQNYII